MNKDDSFWLNMAYASFLILAGYVWWKVFETVGIQTGWIERYDEWFGKVSIGAAIVLGLGSTWFLRQNTERNAYYLSSIAELRKVTWPTFVDTKRLTWIVCIVVAVFSAILSLFDVIWSYALGIILAS